MKAGTNGRTEEEEEWTDGRIVSERSSGAEIGEECGRWSVERGGGESARTLKVANLAHLQRLSFVI